MSGFISGALPSKQITVSNVTLFEIAALHLKDATLWYVIAAMNGLTDPWLVGGPYVLNIPSPVGLVSNGGILGL